MKKLFLISFVVVISAISLAAQTKMETVAKTEPIAQTFPANFKSDGCTDFPNKDYLDCCVQHDLAYFKGGSWTARWRADGQLRKCVAAKNGWWHKPVSLVMWSGVRIGGVPFLPTKFRWGFGKDLAKNTTSVQTPKMKDQLK